MVSAKRESTSPRFGFPDALGLVAASVVVIFMPFQGFALSYPRMIVLVAGSLSLVPLVAFRWRRLRPGGRATSEAVARMAGRRGGIPRWE